MKKKEKESLRKIVIIGLVLVVGYLGYQSMTSGSSPFSEASEPTAPGRYRDISTREEARKAGYSEDFIEKIWPMTSYEQCMDSIGDSAYCKAMYFKCSDGINQDSYLEKGKKDCEESPEGLSCVYTHGRCHGQPFNVGTDDEGDFCSEYSEYGKDLCLFDLNWYDRGCRWEPSSCIGAED